MKKTIQIMLLLVLGSNVLNAQNLIAVENGGNSTFYTNLDSAIINAQSGSTVYIPGGSFALNAPINKLLYIVGVGHHPDSTSATNFSYLIGDFNLNSGSDNGYLTGVYINGSFNIVTAINNYSVSRCNILAVNFNVNTITNIAFSENNVRGVVSIGGSANNLFSNNIVNGFIINIGPENIFSNNIFMASGSCYWGCNGPLKFQSSLVENNIFIGITYGLAECSNSIFNRNLFIENIGFPNGSNLGSNNIVNQIQDSIFISQTGNVFSYTDNYHLKPTCLGKNAGTDGTDVGIYGGLFPWKEGSIPSNPHIQFKNISGSTNSSGALPVNIRVEAQGN